MATIRTRWYTMPKGVDGKRHRVWHESSGITLTDLVAIMDCSVMIDSITSMLDAENPIIKGVNHKQ